RYLRKDGSTFEAEAFVYELVVARRKAFVVTIRDITETRRAQEEVHKSQELLDSVMQGVPAFITTMDRRGRLLFINRVAKRYKRSDVVGTDAFRFISPASRVVMRKALNAVFTEGRVVECEVSGVGDHGRFSYFANRLGPIREGGRVLSAVVVSTDITAWKKAQE